MSKISLTDLVNLENQTTAVNAINANNAAIEAAIENTLSRNGTAPNQMGAVLDMNSHAIINLPAPFSGSSPLRLQDVSGGVSLSPLPTGGTTGQVLEKNSNSDYDVIWGDVSNGGSFVAFFETKALAAAAVIPSSITAIKTYGFYAVGDEGGATFKKVVSLTAGVFGFQSVDGAWWQLSESIVSVLMTGAKGDGGTDDSAAIQIAITSAYYLGGIVFLPEKLAYRIASTISIIHAVSIRGCVKRGSANIYPDPTITAININTTEPVDLRDLSITYPTAASAGTAAIALSSPTLFNGLSHIDNLYIGNSYDAIFTVAAANWIIENCYFENVGRIGILVQNTYQVDAGDSIIQGNTFAGITLAAIYYASSSGLKIMNNKINGATYGVLMEWLGTQSINGATNQPGADLWVSNNSIEGITGISISLGRADASSAFGTAIISDNEMSGPKGISVAPASNFLINLVVTGNNMLGSTFVPACFCLLRYTSGYMIGNNYMQSQFANSQIMNIDSTCTGGVVGPNAGWPASGFTTSITAGTASTTISPT